MRSVAALIVASLCMASVCDAAATADGVALPAPITAVMLQPRYARSSWNLLVTDLATGKTVYALHPDRLAFTGSVRKLFSVGLALNALGANHTFATPVYRRGSTEADGTLRGDLILVGAGDLTFGGRLHAGRIAYTNFDHNDANNLGTAIVTPQDPLRGLNALARQVRASGIRFVSGDVIVDDRLFERYRVPNGNLLVTPILLNENMIDVQITPTQPGKPASVEWRPKTAAFRIRGTVKTTNTGIPDHVVLSNDGLMQCAWPTPCDGSITGTIPAGYRAPLSGSATLVRTFRVEDPASFARIAFVQALRRAGIGVRAPLLAPNAASRLPPSSSYGTVTRAATFVSPPYAEDAKLILKISLNLGANLSLSLFGLTHGQRTIRGALSAERRALISTMHIPGNEFDFPSNGSGSPDSRAAPRATVEMLYAMSRGPNAAVYRAALPVLGVDGSLAGTGISLPARGHVYAKTGTTIDNTGLKAQVLAGYIDAKSGRHLAFALYVNNAGPIKNLSDVATVFQDEARITNAIYESR